MASEKQGNHVSLNKLITVLIWDAPWNQKAQVELVKITRAAGIRCTHNQNRIHSIIFKAIAGRVNGLAVWLEHFSHLVSEEYCVVGQKFGVCVCVCVLNADRWKLSVFRWKCGRGLVQEGNAKMTATTTLRLISQILHWIYKSNLNPEKESGYYVSLFYS